MTTVVSSLYLLVQLYKVIKRLDLGKTMMLNLSLTSQYLCCRIFKNTLISKRLPWPFSIQKCLCSLYVQLFYCLTNET